MPFKRNGQLAIYADVAQTEALFVRLEPQLVAQWLMNRGHQLPAWNDERSARLAILRAASVPMVGDPKTGNPAGEDLLTLVHSFSHSFTG